MIHSAQCTVIIESKTERGYFTDGDVVVGHVEVDVKRDIHITSIEAQLRLEERGRAYFRDSEDLVDLSAAHFDHFEVLWSADALTFDLPNGQGELPKGKYRFPFSFKLPEDCHNLPSSYNIEPSHDFNGIFWGVFATINRDQRLRSNFQGFGEIRMLPRRARLMNIDNDLFSTATHRIHLRLHRRPSFLIGENEKNLIDVEGRVSVLSSGLTQTTKPANKESGELPEIRVAVRSPEKELVLVREVVVFIDTAIITLVNGKEGNSQSVAIVIAKECSEIIRGGPEWQDLTQIISPARIYGLAETWTTSIHEFKHKMRVQFIVAPASKPSRTSILEVSIPVTLHSEATVTGDPLAPPPYEPSS